MYKALENTHPNPSIKRQAANLRYILEAPKLKLGPDERVSLPLLEQDESARYAVGNHGCYLLPWVHCCLFIRCIP